MRTNKTTYGCRCYAGRPPIEAAGVSGGSRMGPFGALTRHYTAGLHGTTRQDFFRPPYTARYTAAHCSGSAAVTSFSDAKEVQHCAEKRSQKHSVFKTLTRTPDRTLNNTLAKHPWNRTRHLARGVGEAPRMVLRATKAMGGANRKRPSCTCEGSRGQAERLVFCIIFAADASCSAVHRN